MARRRSRRPTKGDVGVPDRRPLTDSEGAILALVLRAEPVTAYQIGKDFDRSPVHTLNTSKGKLYPLVHRLHERGLLKSEDVPGDQRGTHRFSSTPLGRAALKRWVQTIRPDHELLHDPLRKKVQAFDLLTQPEQLEWVRTARERLERKLREVEGSSAADEGPFGDLVQESATGFLKARIAWLDKIAERIRSGPAPA